MRRRSSNFSKVATAALAGALILIVGSTIAYAMNTTMNKMPIKKFFSQTNTNAVWDWANINNHSPRELSETADFLYMHQINTVYVDISAYKDLRNNPSDLEKLNRSISQYITAMNKRNIRVLAAAGDTSWSMPENRQIPLDIQQFVFEYNEDNEHKFAGIEFDIESYNQPQFAEASFTEKELVLNEFLDTVDDLAEAQEQHIQDTGNVLELGFAIPYWYDNENQNIRSVTWKDKTGPTLYHILDRLNALPASNVVVMAYRNAATGNDGMIYHSRTELEYAKSRTPNVAIIIGAEVNEIEPEKITFYGRSYTELSSEVSKLYSEFDQDSAFRGIAINDLEGYKQMGATAQ